ncbi:MAG: phenylalanine--tRNA ligase subunit beta, partial [Synergistaceae bacterium]|nr:phenylalanine--tRNA ligase subunit beta [Synergistaceae bacterium]
MLITWNLLKDILSIPASVEEVAERLTLTGCEVESLTRPGEKLSGVRITRINSLAPHPEKETLWVAEMDDGKGTAPVVTAAPNLSGGDYVPWGRPGAVLADGTVLGAKDFGSVRSEGMLLSAEELGVPQAADEFGILRLPKDAPIGEDASSWLGLDDVVLDLSVTPNRGDLLSLLGVAREVYALFPGSKWKKNPADLPDCGVAKAWPVPFQGITLKTPGCSRYCLGLVTDLKAGVSPLRVRIALSLLGMRPISPMVDATNLAMLTLGQPTHAFDALRLPAPEITVRASRPGEEFTSLDGKEHVLTEEDMLITSGDVPVGLAGVMGGENSEILPETNTVFIESASFDSLSVSRTSRRLGIPSEAAFRYARTVDRKLAPVALRYIFSLLEEWSAGTTGFAIIDSTDCPEVERTVPLSRAKLRKILLTDDLDEASAILNRLGILEKSSSHEERFFSVPSWRPDISIEEDLLEEVGRVRGYNETLS